MKKLNLAGILVLLLIQTARATVNGDFEIDKDGVLISYDGTGGNVVIPEEVTAIGKEVFAGCDNLLSISIPGSVTAIGNYAFAYCISLQEITVQWTTPLAISPTVFEGVDKRNCTLNVPAGALEAYQNAAVWKSFLNTSDFEIDENGVLTGYYGSGGNVVIPEEITAIGSRVFQNNHTITSAIIPNSVTRIDNMAFAYCSNLNSVGLPENLTAIDDFAFANCTNLPSISIPNSVTDIGYGAFNYCYDLQEIMVFRATPLALENEIFYGVDKKNCLLKVPGGTKNAYQAAYVWRDFLNIEESGVAIPVVELSKITVSLKNNDLRVNSPVSEKISVYSVTGNLLYHNEKTIGECVFTVEQIQDRIVIVKGSSGWAKKVMK
ncbi:MAG: leucine-rich repeat domain-containing protein [Candidatus Symbiothrix sp.]|jgi:hypothetical protein|nr:leucine-rich repeat domain-containing protein [Candidatus Symbiothrix sp.]